MKLIYKIYNYEDYSLVGYNSMQFEERPTFWMFNVEE
jgi:hypothetical protein